MNAPTLPAYEYRGGLAAWCLHCQAWHFHGTDPGHRVAHCATTTPFTATGYVLEPAGPAAQLHRMGTVTRPSVRDMKGPVG